uniref:Probable purine permease n=1 Tax=Solanum lycopersicum TaxID=4081 RepID=K4C487_SOLLC
MTQLIIHDYISILAELLPLKNVLLISTLNLLPLKNMTISFLSEFVTGTDDFTIRVRICRMWNTINLKKNGELISMDMIFIDEKMLLVVYIELVISRVLVQNGRRGISTFLLINRTGDTTFILFNAVAEKLLDTSAHKLFDKLTTANNDVPVQVQRLCGKEFVFKLRLNHYNLKEGLENFTISKLWILDDNLEVQYKLRKGEKGKNLSKNEIDPKGQGTNGLTKHAFLLIVLRIMLILPRLDHLIIPLKTLQSNSTTKDGKPEKPEDKAEKDEWINVVRETRKELSRQISPSSLRNIIYTIGLLSLIMKVSALFANVITALTVPLIPVLALIFFNEKMSGVKVISMILAIWGFLCFF